MTEASVVLKRIKKRCNKITRIGTVEIDGKTMLTCIECYQCLPMEAVPLRNDDSILHDVIIDVAVPAGTIK